MVNVILPKTNTSHCQPGIHYSDIPVFPRPLQAESKDEAEKPSESAEKNGSGDKTEAADKVKKEGGEVSERDDEESEEGGEAKSSAPSGNALLRPPYYEQ